MKWIALAVILSASPVLVIGTLLAANAIWILNDQHVWWWDQSVYGYWVLRLWFARQSGLSHWIDANLHAMAVNPPLIAWVAQCFVPLSYVTGDVESAILFVNLCAAAGTFVLIYLLTRRLGAGVGVGLVAPLVCGGSALYVGLVHQFMGETVLAFSAAAMIFGAWRAEQRSAARTIAVALLTTSLALLSKASSVTFVLPMLTYTAVALAVKRDRMRLSSGPTDIAVLILAAATATAAVAWYYVNWQHVAGHFAGATVGQDALPYGSAVHVPTKLRFWIWSLARSISSMEVIGFACVILFIAGLTRKLVGSFTPTFGRWIETLLANGTLFVLALAGTVVSTIVAYSLQINEDVRFLTPLIPIVSVIVAWSASALANGAVTGIVLTAMAANAAITYSYAYGANPLRLSQIQWLHQAEPEGREKARLTRVIRSVCPPDIANPLNVVAVSYPTLNANTANFYAQKERLRSGYRCGYETTSWEVSLDNALARLTRLAPAYVLTVAPEKQPPADHVNIVSRPLAEHLKNDARFMLAPESDDYLLIYRMRH